MYHDSIVQGTGWATALVWFRRDLRLHDQPALMHALAQARSVVPLFVVDPRLTGGPASAAARTWFLARSLEALDRELRSRGSGLLLRSGFPEEVVPAAAREVGAEAVVVSRDVTPFAHRRDRAVAAALERDGRRLVARPGLLSVEPEELAGPRGSPASVFTPFWRRLQASGRRPVLAAPKRIPTRGDHLDGPIADQARGPLGGLPADPPVLGLPTPGEPQARARLAAWVADDLEGYAADRDRLDGRATSRLGQDLHLGLLSPRQVEEAVSAAGLDATAFLRQLAWRDFYHHRAFARRASGRLVPEGPFRGVFRSEAEAPEEAAAWREGRTGIPVVDAAMRQLASTGWLGNRARLVVASFLTRHLLLHPRIGERHFLRHLVDGDVANNAGGWQWTAGVGADAQPWFRVFNPVLQGRRFDPDGSWVRRWLPELGRLPAESIHAPWELAPEERRRRGLRLGPGGDYPAPVVDLAFGRERALAAFRAATAPGHEPGAEPGSPEGPG